MKDMRIQIPNSGPADSSVIRFIVKNTTEEELMATVFGPDVSKKNFGNPSGIKILFDGNYVKTNKKIAKFCYSLEHIYVDEVLCSEIVLSGVNKQGLNWTRRLPLNKEIASLSHAAWFDPTTTLSIKVAPNTEFTVWIEGNYIKGQQQKPIDYKLSILLMGTENERVQIDSLIKELQKQLNEIPRNDIEALWCVDNGENSDEEKKKWLINNTTGEYYCFPPNNHSIDSDYIKRKLRVIESIEQKDSVEVLGEFSEIIKRKK